MALAVMFCVPDHPRLSGEHVPSSATLATLEGSSPPERGALVAAVPDVSGVRIIPA